LDERQQRLWMGAEARALGRGGVQAVARATGASVARVSRGLAELQAEGVSPGRVRRVGAGRKPATVSDPGLRSSLLALLEPGGSGDHESALRWTTWSTRRLALELSAAGHPTNPQTVANLLRDEGFRLHGAATGAEPADHPDREGQFRYVAAQAGRHLATGQLVISVETRKMVLVDGDVLGGGQLDQSAAPGRSDLKSGVPGGWAAVVPDHDTDSCALAAVRTWWTAVGQATRPGATRLLVAVDAVRSRADRARQWATGLARFAADTRLTVTWCHLPPGSFAWRPVEHHLVGQTSLARPGRQPVSHEVVIDTVGLAAATDGRAEVAEVATAPLGGLFADHGELPTEVAVLYHDWHSEWNLTFRPDRRG
jgi:hypothetical protein